MQEEDQLVEKPEEEEDDEGPPPGFQCIIIPQSQPTEKADTVAEEEVEEEEDEEDDDGPPPGFDSVVHKASPELHSSGDLNVLNHIGDTERSSKEPPFSSSDTEMSSKEQEIEDEDEDEDDGPPPGWEFVSLAKALPEPPSNAIDISDIKVESNGEMNEDEDDGEGPPPGWETILPHQIPPSWTPPLEPSSALTSNIEIGSQQEIARNVDEVPQSGLQSTPVSGQLPPPPPPPPPTRLHQQPPSAFPCEAGSNKEEDKRPTFVRQSESPRQPLAHDTLPSTTSEKSQLVCGTCWNLLLYPRGAKWVQCPGCQEANLVLEAHEVGQVNCGGCRVLLMYPYGAPAVQCATCCAVTEIGEHNKRPSLSVQQSQRRRRFTRAR